MPPGIARIPEPREWLLTKRCARCRQTKAWALYSPARYWPDGTVRQVQAWCRACKIEHERITPRPVSQHRLNYLAERKRRTRAALRAERVTDAQLPVAPLREWLGQRAADLGGWAALAECLGVSERRLRRVCREQATVGMAVADRWCVALGWHLNDVYGAAVAA